MALVLTGIVTSDKADKTITVTVQSRQTHPLYKKQYTVSRKYTAHDPENKAAEGDKVTIREIRPVSKTKTWELVEIVEQAREKMTVRDEVAEELEPEVAEDEEVDNKENKQ
jgi:small subunit ribosomal protein S17